MDGTVHSWVFDNLAWIMTAVFGAGGFVFMLKQLSDRFDKHEETISFRFDEHEQRIDKRFEKVEKSSSSNNDAIADLRTRMARQEERTEVLAELRTQIHDIWKHIMRNGAHRN